MSKFLLLIFALVAAWWLIKRWRGKDRDEDARGPAPDPAPEQMVTCSRCGLYLPQHEAIAAGDKFFCCAEHRRQAGKVDRE